MRGKLLCARGEEELVICSPEDAACMWVDLKVHDLGMVGASKVYKGLWLYADLAL